MLQRCLDRLADGSLALGPVRVYPMDRIREAHADLENNTGVGKIVVTITG